MSDDQPALLRTPDNRRPTTEEYSPPRMVRPRKKTHRTVIPELAIRSVARRLNFDELEEDWITFPLKFKKIKKASTLEASCVPKSILFLR